MSDIASPTAARRSFSMRHYLLLTMIGGAFLQQVVTKVPFEIVVGYFLIIFNCCILLAARSLIIYPAHLKFILLLFGISIVGAFTAGYSYLAIIPQVLGISVLSIYYFSVISVLGIPVVRLLELYARLSLYVAIIGIGLYLYHTFDPEGPSRLQSVFSEPALFVHATLPGISFYALDWFKHRRGLLPLLTLLIAYALADSALGFIGIVVTVFLLFPRKSPLVLIFAPVLCVAIFIAIYTESGGFRERVDDAVSTTIVSESAADARGTDQKTLGNTNLSVMALLSNGYVAYRAFLSNPLIGTGLGTHRYSYDRYASDVLKTDANTALQLNRDDASSLLLRVTSELGLFGLGSIVFFFVYFGRVGGPTAILVRNSLIPFFVVYLLRMGHYFQLEFELCIMLFVFNFIEDRSRGRDSFRTKIQAARR